MKRMRVSVIAAAIAISTIASFQSSQGDSARRPNVIVISIDTLRPDHLGCYGYHRRTSPAIDAFRREAVLFRTVIASAPSTLPSHASIFTSLAPQHHGASHTAGIPLGSQFVSLTEVLHDAGYRTGAYVAGGQLAPEFGLNQGFETYVVVDDFTFEDVVASATPFLERTSGKPFFLFLHTYEVHHPYTPSPEDLKRFELSTTSSLPSYVDENLLVAINFGGKRITDADRAHIVNAYDAEIYSMDRGFRRLMTELKRLGVYDNSIIVFTSDHGEEFNEHGMMGWHSHTLYDELLRIPLIVRFPGGAHAGKEIGGLVRAVDISPIILDASGVPHPAQFDGFSLATALARGRAPASAALLWQEPAIGSTEKHWGLRTMDWKLYDGKVFDLRKDPHERNDLASKNRPLANGLSSHFHALLRQRPLPETQAIAPDPATIDKLRSLGYIQ